MKLLIIGSGLSAFGACSALLNHNDRIDITVFDIGLNSSYCGQPDKAISNSTPLNGSFYPYGLNDHRWNTKILSRRICSSHAYGGFSSVYSGSFLAPQLSDLSSWPSRCYPQPIDYDSIASKLDIRQVNDELSAVFPMAGGFQVSNPSHLPQTTYVGCSRIGFNKHIELETPFNSSYEFQRWSDQKLITYKSGIYVYSLNNQDSHVLVRYETSGGLFESDSFDYVMIAAGCINTTGIVDRSLYSTGERQYQLKSAPILLQFYFRIWGKTILTKCHDLFSLKKSDLCRSFVEHYFHSCKSWSHTQLSPFNSTALKLISDNLPRPLYFVVKALLRQFIFSLTVFHSDLGPVSTITCAVDPKNPDAVVPNTSIRVEEPEWICSNGLIFSLNKAILSRISTLRLLPIPFARKLADYMRKNHLGGWHFGGSLPMTAEPFMPHHIHTSGQVHGLRRAYVIDASSLPSIPGSSIAYLTMANAHRIAREFASNTTSI